MNKHRTSDGGMKFKPSRILNDTSGMMGFATWDIAGLGYTLVFTHRLLSPFGWELLSFVVTGVFALALLQVRLNTRKKSIRDFLFFLIRSIRL